MLNGYIVQGSNAGKTDLSYHAILLLKPKEICHCLNSVQYLQLARDCYKENRQRADNQCP